MFLIFASVEFLPSINPSSYPLSFDILSIEANSSEDICNKISNKVYLLVGIAYLIILFSLFTIHIS